MHIYSINLLSFLINLFFVRSLYNPIFFRVFGDELIVFSIGKPNS